MIYLFVYDILSEVFFLMNYDVIIIGAGPGGIFSAFELVKQKPELKVAVFEAGHSLEKRRCPIDGVKVKSCIDCKTCSIMSGFGGAGAFSDGKYNITNDFGGTLYEYIGKKNALDLMRYVDEINMAYGGEGTKLYSTAGTKFKNSASRTTFIFLMLPSAISERISTMSYLKIFIIFLRKRSNFSSIPPLNMFLQMKTDTKFRPRKNLISVKTA